MVLKKDAYSVRFSASAFCPLAKDLAKVSPPEGKGEGNFCLIHDKIHPIFVKICPFMESLLIRKRAKAFRLEAGLTTLDVAEAIGLDRTSYERFERGAQKTLDFNLLVKIAPVLGKHYMDLFPEEDMVRARLKARSEALAETGITVQGSTTELTPEASQLRNEHWELLTEQAATNRQQATIIEFLTKELVALRKELSILRGEK